MRKLTVYLTFLLLCSNSYAVWPVFDAENLSRSIQLYNNAKEQLTTANNLYNESKKMTSMLDGGMTTENWLHIARNNLSQMESLFKVENIGHKTLSKQNFLNTDANQNFTETKSALGKSLYVYSDNPTTVNRKHVETVTRKRAASLDFAVVTSIAEAGEQKDELVKSAKQAKVLTEEAMRSDNLHQDLINTNKMLAAIYSELNQQRAIQAQLLELLSASIAQSSAIVSEIK